jgi:hypothetical protein
MKPDGSPPHMQLVQEFLDVLARDIRLLEDVAYNIDLVLPHLAGDEQKSEWSAKRDFLRARAEELRGIEAKVKKDNEDY